MRYPSGLFSTHARNTAQAPTVKCPLCGGDYTLGVNGTIDGCDECTGVERLPQGYVAEICTCLDPIHEGDNPNCPMHGGK